MWTQAAWNQDHAMVDVCTFLQHTSTGFSCDILRTNSLVSSLLSILKVTAICVPLQLNFSQTYPALLSGKTRMVAWSPLSG